MIRVEVSRADPQLRSVRAFAAVLVLAAAAGYIPPAVDLPHIALHSLHLMAPTCGLGRAGRAMLRLEFGRAVSFNPAIVPLVAIVAAGAAEPVKSGVPGLVFMLSVWSAC